MRIIGRVLEYDGAWGRIATIDNNDNYLEYDFVKKDINISECIKVGDVVEFIGEEKHGILKAFFIKKYNNKEISNDAEQNIRR